ncbi:hypothetical protein NVS55_29440 [Myxococcus stipitatus]|uniref:hypothetical protein n=1 Tax=Myxococcus stipitatus TaxID=83455 RepID=UPI0031453933
MGDGVLSFSTYRVQAGTVTPRHRVALIPDGRVSVFSLSPHEPSGSARVGMTSFVRD